MNVLKKLAGVGAFAVALVLAVVVNNFYNERYGTPPPDTPPAPPTAVVVPVEPAAPAPPPIPATSPRVFHRAKLITLDYSTRESYTMLELELDASREAPERVWIATYFFVPGGDGGVRRIWGGEPVEVALPFTGGGRTTVTMNVAAPLTWAREPGAPQSGYYARVRVSTESADDARVRRGEFDFNITDAVPVVVQGAPRSSGR